MDVIRTGLFVAQAPVDMRARALTGKDVSLRSVHARNIVFPSFRMMV